MPRRALVFASPAFLAGILALLLLGTGASTLLAGDASMPSSAAEVSAGTLLPLNEATSATPGRRVSEFIVARDPSDPRHVAASAIDWDDPAGSSGCDVVVSRDGGRSWAGGPVPTLSNPYMQGDPWVAIGPDGALHVVCIETAGDGGSNARLSYYYSKSADGENGDAWTPRVRIPSPGGVDKGAIGVDSSGVLYVCYSGLSLHRSTDGGASWSPRLNRPGGVVGNCNGFAEGPDGTMYLHFVALNGGSLPFRGTGVIASTDHGLTWSPATVAGVFWLERSHYASPVEPFQAPLGTFPQMAVSPTTGHVFLAWQQVRADDTFESVLARSTDQGATWTRVGVPFPAESACAGCHVEHPGIAIDPAGRLGLRWTRYIDPDSPFETWFIATGDEGATWTTPLLLGQTDPSSENPLGARSLVPSVDPAGIAHAAPYTLEWASQRPADPSEAWGVAYAGVYAALFPAAHAGGGDYWGMTATDEGFLVAWIAHYQTGKPEIWTRLVAWS